MEERESENQHEDDLEVLNSFDLIITTSTSDSECVSEAEEQMLHPKRRTTCVVKESQREPVLVRTRQPLRPSAGYSLQLE